MTSLQDSPDPVSRAMARLIPQKPFYGYLLSRLRRIRDPALPAPMAVSITPDGELVLLSSEAGMVAPADGSPAQTPDTPMRPWTDGELDAVLEHECLHIVHSHITRRDGREPRPWNVATDIAINQYITGLPSNALWPHTYGFPEGQTAEQYYELLQDQEQAHSESCPRRGDAGGEAGAGSQDAAAQGDEEGADGGSGSSSATDAGATRGPAGPAEAAPEDGGEGESGTAPCPSCASTLDDHSGWQDRGSVAGDMASEAIRGAVEQAWRLSGQGRGQGYLAGDVQRRIEEMLKRPYHWEPLLRRFCHGAIKLGRRSTRFRPHRRYGPLFPGKRPRRGGRIAVLLDTSASIGDDTLAQFLAEIRKISKYVDVVAVECDARIQDIYEYHRNRTPEFKGGGGTVFIQVFEAIAGTLPPGVHPRQGLLGGVEALVILTDGAASVPETNITKRRILWALTPGGKQPVEYGSSIRIGE